MNNETLERLRLPAAWVLIGAVGAGDLAGFIRLIAGSGYPGSFASAMSGAGGGFYGLSVVIMLAIAVLLVLTSERTRASAFGVVLTSLILSGLGLLFAGINLITEFIAASDLGRISFGFAGFLTTLGQGAVLGVFAFALLKVLSDQNLVPRATPQAQSYSGYPQGYAQPGHQDPGLTGGHPTVDPAQAQQAYGQGQGYDAAAQQAYDPNQYGQAQQYGTGAQQAYGQGQGYDAAAQQAYDPSQYAPQGEQAGASGEQAAQEAIDHGWYGQQSQGRPPGAETFNPGEAGGAGTTGQGGPVYGDQYGSGSGYSSDQPGQGGTGGQQGWYGGEGQR